MTKRILVALSESTPDITLESAIETTREHGAQLTVVHVVDPTPYFSIAADQMCGLIFDTLEARGRETANRISNALEKAGCPAETCVVMLSIGTSTVGHEIASFSNEIDADLIIVGSRKSRWPSWLSDDVAADIQRATTTPIQIVPRGKAPTASAGYVRSRPGDGGQSANYAHP
jgi:nucleotide-binding universal stress UspA family protein